MTDELGSERPVDYFSSTVESTVETPSGRYVQRIYSSRSETYGLQVREKRYGEPTVISSGIRNREDADQLLALAEEDGIIELLQGDRE